MDHTSFINEKKTSYCWLEGLLKIAQFSLSLSLYKAVAWEERKHSQGNFQTVTNELKLWMEWIEIWNGREHIRERDSGLCSLSSIASAAETHKL